MSEAEVSMRRALLWAALCLPSVALGAESSILEPHPSRNDNYGESFTFVADLNDGTYIWTQFSFTHLGPGSNHAACRAVVVTPDKKEWAPGERYSKKDWGYNSATQTLKVGHCTAQEGERPRVRAIFPDGRLEIRFSKPFAPVSPPGTTLIKGDSRYRASVLVSNVPVEVTLGLPKTPLKELKGGGYADHSHSTWSPAKLAKQWVRFRALRDSPFPILVGRESHDGEFQPVYFLQEGSAPRTYQSFSMNRSGPKEQPQWQVLVTGKSGKVRLQTNELLYRSAPVEELGFLGNLVKPVVGSPINYTFRATLAMDDGPAIPGLMEVTLSSE